MIPKKSKQHLPPLDGELIVLNPLERAKQTKQIYVRISKISKSQVQKIDNHLRDQNCNDTGGHPASCLREQTNLHPC